MTRMATPPGGGVTRIDPQLNGPAAGTFGAILI
jgi:hypothetical protein